MHYSPCSPILPPVITSQATCVIVFVLVIALKGTQAKNQSGARKQKLKTCEPPNLKMGFWNWIIYPSDGNKDLISSGRWSDENPWCAVVLGLGFSPVMD